MLNSQSNPTVTNCTFSGNSAGIWGGGLSSTLNSFPTITNCTFSGNTAPVGGGIYTTDAIGGFSVTVVVNTISWGNNPDQIGDEGGATTTVNYSDVQGGWSGAGSNNIDADPLFVDPNNGDYHLLPSSPCIDAGDNTAVPAGVTTDLDGNPRFHDDLGIPDGGNPDGVNPIVDMGAYEFQGQTIPGDLDGDGEVGIVDFLALLAAWEPCPDPCPPFCFGDIDGDCNVGITDFLLLLGNWG